MSKSRIGFNIGDIFSVSNATRFIQVAESLGVLLIFALAIDTARRAFIAKSLLSRA